MTLEDLPIGKKVTVELSFGESKMEFDSKVTGLDVNGVFIQPYLYKDVVVDFNTLPYKDIFYRVHYIDGNGARNTWKNVGLSIAKHKGETEYLISTKIFSKYSESGERRENNRVQLYGSGFVENQLSKRFQCALNDISDSGISFFSNPGEITVADNLIVSFYDVAKEKDFSITLKVRVVRVDQRDKGTLYACRIISPPKDLFAYICLKRMEKRAEDKLYAR